MSSFVLDASATLAWCFQDEATPWSDALLHRLRSGDDARVPAHWPVEVSNAFLSAARRGRAQMADVRAYWDDLEKLPIAVEPAVTPSRSKAILDLSTVNKLTFYDCVYLDLALNLRLPLATLDDALRQAASANGVALL